MGVFITCTSRSVHFPAIFGKIEKFRQITNLLTNLPGLPLLLHQFTRMDKGACESSISAKHVSLSGKTLYGRHRSEFAVPAARPLPIPGDHSLFM